MKIKMILIVVLVILVLGVIWAGKFISSNVGNPIELLKEGDKSVLETVGGSDASPFKLPPGFKVEVFAQGLKERPRVIIKDTGGTILVSLIGGFINGVGKVVALPDRDQDGIADEMVTVVEGLKRPHGLAINCFPADEFGIEFDCKLFIAEEDQVAVYDYDDDNLKATNKKTIIDLPSGDGHNTRTILFTQTEDGEKLLTSVGSSCNVCNEEDSPSLWSCKPIR